MTPARIRIAVYGELDLNLIDGSSVWLQSAVNVLAAIGETEIVVLRRDLPRRGVLTEQMEALANVRLVDAASEAGLRRLAPQDAARALEELDAERPFDVVLVRGPAAADALAVTSLAERLWIYHVPTAADQPDVLRRRFAAAHRILCQTDAVRARLVLTVPEIADRCLLLPPMVPPTPVRTRRFYPAAARLVYAGKLAPEYCFFEMLGGFAELRQVAPGSELHIAGDKIHDPPADRSFRTRAQAALRDRAGVKWHGAMERSAVSALLSSCDIGLSVRVPELDESDELSTKILEYGAAGLAVVLNQTPQHERILGEDYPLFVRAPEETAAVLLRCLAAPADVAEAARRCQDASRPHRFEVVAAALRPHLVAAAERVAGGAEIVTERPPVLLIAGHDLKFAEPIRAAAERSGWTVRTDTWTRHDSHDEATSRTRLQEAASILCEWCMGNAGWYARNRRPEQLLYVRFHRSELETPYPRRLDPRATDGVVFVAEWVREAAVERFGWPRDAPLEVIPNPIDTERMSRRKLEGSEFNLGMVGYVPKLKRLDVALDLVELLRSAEPRFRLIVKGKPPWELGWMLGREEERPFYEECFRRIARSPLLGPAVSFEPHAPDMPEFLRKIGWILSLSEVEGHAVALAEGMASGAVPVVLDRAGAAEQYSPDWVHASVEAAAETVLELSRSGCAAGEGAKAAAWATRWSFEVILPQWCERLLRSARASVGG